MSLKSNCLLLVLLGAVLRATAEPAEVAEHVIGEVLVTFREDIPKEDFSGIGGEYGMELLHAFQLINSGHFALIGTADAEAVIGALQVDSRVVSVDRNHLHKPQAVNDPAFPFQWYLNNTGQVVNGILAKRGVDIDWPEAMEIYDPKGEIIVAVIDTGVAFDHPEFLDLGRERTTLWINEAEVGGVAGRDDDNNGYVDDIFGWDFFARNRFPLDEDGHGTLVAGIIAGLGNNAKGGTGICPNARIMCLRAGDQIRGIPTSAWMEALEYAVNNGAKIVNMSFGGYGYSYAVQLLFNAIADRDVILVMAAGNDANDNDRRPVYPAGYVMPNKMVVAAVDPTGRLASYSNYGVDSVFYAAPGSDIYGPDVVRLDHYRADFSNPTGWSSGPLPGNFSTYTQWGLQHHGGRWYLADSAGTSGLIPYQSNTHTYAESPWIRLDVVSPRLEIELYYDLEVPSYFLFWRFNTDYVKLEIARDGGFWEELDHIEGSIRSNYVNYRRYDLYPYRGEWVKFRFRLVTDFSLNYLGVYVGDFRVTKVTLFDYTGREYGFNSGTSFAAPVVAGIAALVWTHNPRLKAKDVSWILWLSALEQAPIPELEGKILIERIVNAKLALEITDEYSMALMRLWESSESVGNSWVLHPRFGLLALPEWIFSGWLYHTQVGWVHVEYDTEDSVYIFQPGGRWGWVSLKAPGYVFDLFERKWYRR